MTEQACETEFVLTPQIVADVEDQQFMFNGALRRWNSFALTPSEVRANTWYIMNTALNAATWGGLGERAGRLCRANLSVLFRKGSLEPYFIRKIVNHLVAAREVTNSREVFHEAGAILKIMNSAQEKSERPIKGRRRSSESHPETV